MPDSLREKYHYDKTMDSLRQLQQRANLDQLEQKVSVQRLQDSLHIHTWADSLRAKLDLRTNLDSLALTRKIDSLQHLQLPTGREHSKLDSVLAKRDQLRSEIAAKESQLQENTTGRLKKWEANVRAKLKLDSLGINGSVDVPGMQSLGSQLPGGQLPGLDLPQMPGVKMDMSSLALPEMPSLGMDDFTGLNLSPDLSELSSQLELPQLNAFNEWKGQLAGVNSQIKSATDMLHSPDKAAEAALGKIDEVADANKQLAEMEKLKAENEALQMAEKMKDPEAMKEEGKKQAMEKAIDHFADKGEGLKNAMNAVGKYKAKYSSLESLSKIPKGFHWPKNGLKGRPFRERFKPGINFGVKNYKDTLILDFFPQVSYRITGRLSAGLGGYVQLKEMKPQWKADRSQPRAGTTLFVVFKMVKSMHMRFEVDGVRTLYRSYNPEILSHAEWRWRALTGVQNVFRINRSFSANAQVLYDFRYKFIHSIPERLVLRFGVEYTLPRKKVKEQENKSG